MFTKRKELIFLILSTPSSVLPFTSSSSKHIFRYSAVAAQSYTSTSINNNMSSKDKEYYRSDGVRIDFDPYAPGMAEKYGLPGSTDDDGFDPYADTVGAGIYGGSVKRDDTTGEIVIGQQYQNHNQPNQI